MTSAAAVVVWHIARGSILDFHGCDRHLSSARCWLSPAGVVLAIAAAFAAAAAFVSIRFMSKGESALSIAMWFHLSSIVMSAVPLAVRFAC